MIKWGDFDGIEVDALREVHRLLAAQKHAVGDTIKVDPFTPGDILAKHGISEGLRLQAQFGPLIAFASVTLQAFLLGYFYRCLELGDLRLALDRLQSAELKDTIDELRDQTP